MIRRLSIAVLLAVSILQCAANIASGIDDRAGSGTRAWEVWTWEISSHFVWVAIWPIIWLAVARFRPPRFGWPAALLLHLVCTIPVSLLHVLGMMALREAVYAAMGSDYDFGPFGRVVIYEYRKDIVTYCIIGFVFALIQWRSAIADRFAAQTVAPRDESLVVRDGAVTHHIPPDEIELVESAGNYVALYWQGRVVLHRGTLNEIEARLTPHGFVRIHRTRLVRRAAIRTIETRQSGDFAVALESGVHVKGSRRYRL